MPKNTDGTFTLCKHCLKQAVREQCAGRSVCALERAWRPATPPAKARDAR